MKINFIIPFIQKTGGILVVLEHARHLRLLGQDVRVYYPLLPYKDLLYAETSATKKVLRGLLKPFLLNLVRFRKSVPWYAYPDKVWPIPWVSSHFVRNAEITIATAWVTAYSVSRMDQRFGRKFYFIQHYEQWNADPELVDASYRLPLNQITIAPWLTELMRVKFTTQVKAEIANGIDFKIFTPLTVARTWSKPRVLMIYHEQKVKGTDDGLEVLNRIHKRFPHVIITMFGHTPFRNCPEYIEFHLAPSLNTIVKLYQESQIYLCSSLSEGWHLPPMEAMACQAAVVATNVGCIPTLFNGKNMLVSEPHDIDTLERNVAFLLEHHEECDQMALRGFNTVSDYTWEKASLKLNLALNAA
jgi:glycosyltransferase involved in cell wall biosynthesis